MNRVPSRPALLLLPALLAMFSSLSYLYAQALPTASGPGSYVSAGVGVSAYQADYGRRVLGGGIALLDVHPTWRYGLEGEARLLRLHTSEDVSESTYLVGPHVYLHSGKVRPYVKFLGGAGRIVLPFNYAKGTFFAYAPGAGIDYALGDRVSFRVIDFEYQAWPQFPFGNLHPYGLSTAIVFRLNGLRRFPRR